MTKEDFLKNYEYIITRRALRKEFPFIMDVLPVENFEQYDFLKYVNIVIDIYKLLEQHPELGPIYPHLSYMMKSEDKKYFISYTILGFFEGDESVAKQINSDINDVIDAVYRSQSIPADMKLDKGMIGISQYATPVDLVKRHSDKAK